jgi:peptidoglycan/xylan/chitin deacetylase (PgdA/CDA1 family)
MKIGVAVLLICCLFMIGCSRTYHSAIQSPTQVQSLEQPLSHTPLKYSNGLLGFQQHEWTFSVVPTTVPKPTQKPTQKPIQRPLRPKVTIKKKKEPSVPAQQSQQKKLTLPQLRLKYPQFFRLNGSNQESKIALTFDDGPDNKYTPAILDILRRYHVKATFFVLGVRAQANPSIIRRIVNEGHVIGNHSYDHANPAKITEAQFEKQFTRTQLILHNLIGYEPKLIRTPYGALQENQLRWAAKNGLVAVNWDVDSLDWKELNDSQVVANIMEHTHKGAIILQHSAGGDHQDLSGTVKALPIIIEQLKKQGFKLVTVPELLHLPTAK